MTKKLKTKKRKPTDATMRNTKAANKRFKIIEHNIKLLKGIGDCQSTRLDKLEKQMKHIYDACFTS